MFPSPRRNRNAILGTLVAGVIASSCAAPPPPAPPAAPPATTPREGAPATAPAPTTPVPQPVRITAEPSIEVGIGLGLDTLSIAPAGYALVRRVANGRNDAIGEVRVPLRVARSEMGFRVSGTFDSGEPLALAVARGETLWVAPKVEPGAATGTSLWNGKTWRGELKVFVGPSGKLTLVSRLPLETYLLGVVPGEIGSLAADLLQAGRAQAIAARSYTLFYKGRRGAEGFDLFGTVEDQVYGPIESERPLATQCVETTRGLVALSGEIPIRANYYSTCGGITADVWEGWATEPRPYLVSHRDRDQAGDHCAASPHHRWREEWSAADFLATVATYAPPEGVALPAGGLGELVDVRVAERSKSGRVWRLEIETTTGLVEVPAYSLRRVLRRPPRNLQILRSNLFKVDVRRDPRTREARAVLVSGAGSGHGVGLCQTGAIGMARAGYAADRIVTHYYPGIDLRRLY